jgi:putative transposase
MPGWTGGPRERCGQPEAARPALALAEPVARFDRWVCSYNAERPHGSLGGRTPLERWTSDPAPPRFVASEDARRLLTARGARVCRRRRAQRRPGLYRGRARRASWRRRRAGLRAARSALRRRLLAGGLTVYHAPARRGQRDGAAADPRRAARLRRRAASPPTSARRQARPVTGSGDGRAAGSRGRHAPARRGTSGTSPAERRARRCCAPQLAPTCGCQTSVRLARETLTS